MMSTDKKIQLFLLPFAGGSSLSFMKVGRFLDHQIEAISIEYAGRGKRKAEPFIYEYNAFLEDVNLTISSLRNRELPYAILGYSMGSVLAFDISRQNSESPVHSFFCAEGGLISENSVRKYGLLNDKEFTNKILALGGVNDRIRANEEVLRQTLDLIKADHVVLSKYQYSGGIINNNATIIYGKDDSTSGNIKEWNSVVNGHIDYYEMNGGHFFINQCYKEIAKIINNKLLEN